MRRAPTRSRSSRGRSCCASGSRAAWPGSPRYPWIVLAVALFGLFSVGFTITILSVSIPRIAEELGSDTSTITWVVTGPLLAFAVVGPAMGKLGDLHGHRRVYCLSMACVSLFAGLTAVAWSAGSLIAFRTLGAATGAAVGPASIAIINRLFPRERRVQAMGYWSMVGCRRSGDRRGGRRADRRDVRVALDLRRPGAAHAGRAAARHAASSRRPSGASGRRSTPRAPSSLAVGATSLLFAINRGPLLGVVEPADRRRVRPGAAGHRRRSSSIERRVAHPLLPLAYVRRRNFTFAIAHAVLHELRLHGRVRHHADLPRRRCSATPRRRWAR